MKEQSPPKRKRWWAAPTAILLLGLVGAFAFMAGGFGSIFVDMIRAKELVGPGEHVLNLDAGQQTIFERIGSRTTYSAGPINVTTGSVSAPDLGIDAFTVIGPGGTSIPVREGNFSETMTINERVYVGVARFTAPTKDTYTLRLAGDGTVIVTRSIGSTFLRNWPYIVLSMISASVGLIGFVLLIARVYRRNNPKNEVTQSFLPL